MGTEGTVISIEQAKNRISNLGTDEVRALTVRRLLGEDTMPVGRGYDEEPSEDVIIQLLRAGDLDSTIRDAIIAGCKKVYARLWHWLVLPETCSSPGQPDEVAVRLCSVVDVTAPEGLQGPADSLLTLALDTPDVSSDVRKAAVRAAMGYPQSEAQVSLWERVLKRPEVAAYGFNALLSIDPRSPRIERALKELWRRQIIDDWPVDTAFLARRAARERDSDSIITGVLSALRREFGSSDGQKYWKSIEAELQRRPWTRDWMHTVEDVRQSEFPMLNLQKKRFDYSGLFIARGFHAHSPDRLRLVYSEGPETHNLYGQYIAVYTQLADFKPRVDVNEWINRFSETYRITRSESSILDWDVNYA